MSQRRPLSALTKRTDDLINHAGSACVVVREQRGQLPPGQRARILVLADILPRTS
jgi:hypothetical protein